MKITREFAPADRYLYDFGPCSAAKGWAQVDTEQDAAYFGTWANPIELKVFTYCEGDTTLQECETIQEFIEALREIEEFEIKSERKPPRIDTRLCDAMKKVFMSMGLKGMLH